MNDNDDSVIPRNEAIVASKLFSDNSDHKQFQTIYQSIHESALVNNLNITHYLKKEIAEYATGEIKYCMNEKCNRDLSVLYKDGEIYNDDHTNSHKVGYKYCYVSDQYFCIECMKFVKTFDCNTEDLNEYGKLYYLPNCDKCHFCDQLICPDRRYRSCNKCDSKICESCSENKYLYSYEWNCKDCVECKQLFCDECFEFVAGDNEVICKGCYDKTSTKCDKCRGIVNISYQCGFDGINRSDRFKKFSIKCTNCKTVFCSDCNEYIYCYNCRYYFCEECVCSPWGKDGENICVGCYDVTIVQCGECKTEYKLVYESNDWIYSSDGKSYMKQCEHWLTCQVFVCFHCNKQDRNGKVVICRRKNCKKKVGTYCNKHVPQRLCFKHQ